MSLTNIHSSIHWLASEVPSDLTVETAGSRFAVHKAPLLSKCGRIRRMFAQSTSHEDQVWYLLLPEMPGGAEAFEIVAKYCYGIDPVISTYNVAMIRCAARYLEMDPDDAEHGNGLESVAEAYFNRVVLSTAANAISVLHKCDNLLPLAEELQIVNLCIDKIVYDACDELMSSGCESEGQKGWIHKLSDLHIDFFHRIASGIKSSSVEPEIISGALMHYARTWVEKVTKKKYEQRSVVEGIVSLLPPGKNGASTSFLSGLLRTAITVDASPQCRMELESRLAMDLESATSHDLLILSFDSHSGDALFDVDVVHRVLTNFMAIALIDDSTELLQEIGIINNNNNTGGGSAMAKVSELMDSYLAEIAPEESLNVSKFILLAGALPEKGRLVDDGLYRAIDICLKAHPSATDGERNKLCKLMDCQKLSAEACMHAAKNQRLPLHVVVQVLYFEQLRLRVEMKSGSTANECADDFKPNSQLMNNGSFFSTVSSSRDGYESVRVENKDLRFQFCRMRMRMTDLEKECLRMNQIMVRPSRGPNNLLHSISKNLSKLNSVMRKGIKCIVLVKRTACRRRRSCDHSKMQTASTHLAPAIQHTG